jgi:hypothetical protein
LGASLAGIYPQRGAEGRPVVAGGRLYPDALEWAVVAQPGVHDAIERHAAR